MAGLCAHNFSIGAAFNAGLLEKVGPNRIKGLIGDHWDRFLVHRDKRYEKKMI